MSDLQDLIHKTSIDCIEKGQRMERERIIKLLREHSIEADEGGWTYCQGCKWDRNRGMDFDQHLIELINGGTEGEIK